METQSRRLTKAERDEWERRFHRFMVPNAMLALEDELAEIVGKYFFIQTGLQFAREAHIAGHVARLMAAKSVRLLPETRPDCEMVISNQIVRFEITEADEPGRRRGDEYREEDEDAEPTAIDLPTELVLARAAQAPEMLRLAAERKAQGDYDPECGLIIYLNLSEFGWRRAEIESAMGDAVVAARTKFKRVVILWQDRLYVFAGLKAAA